MGLFKNQKKNIICDKSIYVRENIISKKFIKLVPGRETVHNLNIIDIIQAVTTGTYFSFYANMSWRSQFRKC